MNYLDKPFKYIYNRPQALFFSNNGAEIIETDINPRSRNIYFKFKNNEKLQELFTEWNNRKH